LAENAPKADSRAETKDKDKQAAPEATKNLTPDELRRKAILENLPPGEREKFIKLSARIRNLHIPSAPTRPRLEMNMTKVEHAQFAEEKRHHEMLTEMNMRYMNEAIADVRLYGENNPLKELAMEDLSETISREIVDPNFFGTYTDKSNRRENITYDQEKGLLKEIVKWNVKDVVDGIKIDGYKHLSDDPAKRLFNLEANLNWGYSLGKSGEMGKHFNDVYSSLIKPSFGKRLYRDAKDMFFGSAKKREQEEIHKTNDVLTQKQMLEGALFHSLVSGDTKPLKGELFQTEGEAQFRTRPYQIESALARMAG
jgi:hypothetical protein